MEKLALCRMCLTNNVPMRLVVKKNLQEMFKQLTAVPFVTDDRRPAVACVMCCARLHNCYEFMNNCLQSEELLQQVLNRDVFTLVTLEQLPSTKKFGKSPVVHTNCTGVLSDNTEVHMEGQNSMIDDIQVKEEITEAVTNEHLQEIERSDTDPAMSRTIIKAEPEDSYLNEIEIHIKSESDDIESSEEQYIEYDKSSQWSNIDVDSLSEYKASHNIHLKTMKVVQECGNISDEKQAPPRVTESQNYDATTTHKKNELTEAKVLGRSCDRATFYNYNNEASEFKRNTKSDNSSCSSQHLACETSQRHQNIISNNINTSHVEKRFQCDICNKQYNVKGNLVRHLSIHTGDKSYECNVCNKLFNRKESLVRHIRIHNNDKNFKCKICSKCFNVKSHLVEHNRIHGDKPYNCNVCRKRFVQKRHLERHIRIHTGDKPYKCNVCSKSFVQKSDLDRHYRIHTGDKPYKCNVCSKCFAQKYDLVKHNRVHSGDKPYNCNICGKCFSAQSGLVAHNRMHTGDKPFKCNICSKSFTIKSALHRHISAHR